MNGIIVSIILFVTFYNDEKFDKKIERMEKMRSEDKAEMQQLRIEDKAEMRQLRIEDKAEMRQMFFLTTFVSTVSAAATALGVAYATK